MENFSASKKYYEGQGISVIKLAGSMDSYTCAEFEAAVDESFEDGYRKIIVDLYNLDYTSSAGLGVFIAMQKQADDEGGQVGIVNISADILDIFGLIGMQDLIPVFDNMSEAIVSFCPHDDLKEKDKE